MSNTLVPDTHSLLWFLARDKRLSERARLALREAFSTRTPIVVPLIVLVEALRLVEKQKTPLTMDLILDQLSLRPNLHLAPIDLDVFAAVRAISSRLEMHDRIIAATAQLYGGLLVTTDPAFEGVVETLW